MRVAAITSCLLLFACGRFNFGVAPHDGGDDDDDGAGGDDGGSGSAHMDAPDSCTATSGTLSTLGQQPHAIWNTGAYRVVWVDNTAAIAQLAYASVSNDGVKSATTQISASANGVVGGQYVAPLGPRLTSSWQEHTAVLGTEQMLRADFAPDGSAINRGGGDFRDVPPSPSLSRRYPILIGPTGAIHVVTDLRTGDFKTFGTRVDNAGNKNAADIETVPMSARDVIHDVAQVPDENAILYESASGVLRIGLRSVGVGFGGADADVTAAFMGLPAIGAMPTMYAVAWSNGVGLALTRIPPGLAETLVTPINESSDIGNSWPSVVWSGDRWIVGWIDETARILHVLAIDSDGLPIATLINQSAPGSFDTQITLAANGASVFVAWASTSGVTYQLLCP